jgi:hypothetical protein
MIQTVGLREVILGILIVMAMTQIMTGKATMFVLIAGIYYASDYKGINRSLRGLWEGVTDTSGERVHYTMNSRKHEMTFNGSLSHPEVVMILNKLKKYRKYNKPSYDKGYRMMLHFLYLLRKIQRDIPHSRDIYENADTVYKSAIKEFQSLSVSVPAYTYKSSRTRPETHEKVYYDYSEKVGVLCKELNDVCYYLLYDLSLQINADWLRDPMYTKSEIIQSSIEASNAVSQNHIY